MRRRNETPSVPVTLIDSLLISRQLMPVRSTVGQFINHIPQYDERRLLPRCSIEVVRTIKAGKDSSGVRHLFEIARRHPLSSMWTLWGLTQDALRPNRVA